MKNTIMSHKQRCAIRMYRKTDQLFIVNWFSLQVTLDFRQMNSTVTEHDHTIQLSIFIRGH